MNHRMTDFIVEFLVAMVCELEVGSTKMILYMVKGLQMMKRNRGSYLKRVSKQTLAEFSIMRQENEAREMNLICK